jgi:uncharacterized protein
MSPRRHRAGLLPALLGCVGIACAAAGEPPESRTAPGGGAPARTAAERAADVPTVDHHAHAWSTDATAALVELKRFFNEPLSPEDTASRSADWLIANMDAAGVRHAHVLSVAYWFGSPPLQGDGEAGRVRAENLWIADAVHRYPDRLTGFCSVNPLRDYALEEVEVCAADPRLSGLKLHLANSFADLGNEAHIAQVEAVFLAANRHRLPIVAHIWTPAWTGDPSLAARDARVLVGRLLPHLTGVPLQLAHLAGGGAWGTATDSAVAVLIDAIERRETNADRLWFDIAAVVHPRHPEAARQQIAERIRRLGVQRVVYGTDGAPAAANWQELRTLLPLTDEEFATIGANRLPVR